MSERNVITNMISVWEIKQEHEVSNYALLAADQEDAFGLVTHSAFAAALVDSQGVFQVQTKTESVGSEDLHNMPPCEFNQDHEISNNTMMPTTQGGGNATAGSVTHSLPAVLDNEDAFIHVHTKTEPAIASEGEQENTLMEFAIKQEIYTAEQADCLAMDQMEVSEDKGTRRAQINDHNSAALLDAGIVKSEKENLQNVPDMGNREQDSNTLDTTEEKGNQQQARRMEKNHDQTFHKHTKKTGHACPVCGKVFDKSQACLRHLWHSHTGEKSYTCNLCGKAFKYARDFRLHKLSHSDEKLHSCDLCEKTFKVKFEVQRHKAACHSDERPYSCDKCEKTFKRKADVQAHLATRHSDERPYSCDLCGRIFKLKSDVRKHLAIRHSDERPYSCDVCGKTFKLKIHVQQHKTARHSGERPYFCGKTFKRKTDVRPHIAAQHSDERPYSCDLCHKTFKQKAHVQAHIAAQHSDERPYSCDLCHKTYKRNAHLQRHKTACH